MRNVNRHQEVARQLIGENAVSQQPCAVNESQTPLGSRRGATFAWLRSESSRAELSAAALVLLQHKALAQAGHESSDHSEGSERFQGAHAAPINFCGGVI